MSAQPNEFLYSVPLHSVKTIDQPRVFAEDMRYPIWDTKPKRNQMGQVLLDRYGRPKLVEFRRYPIVYECRHGNVVVNTGKVNILYSQFIPSQGVKIIAGGVGSNTANTTDITQIHLGNELIAGSARVSLTNTAGVALTTTDVAIVTGQTYTELVTVQYIYLTTDSNNGSVFGEYGLFSSTTLPASGTSTSGVMYARYVPTSSFTKNSSFQVTMQWGQAA